MSSDRSVAARIAGRVAGTYPLETTYHRVALAADMERITPEVSALVSAATGLPLPGAAATLVIGRGEWIERNLASFTRLMEPVRRALEERVDTGRSGGRSVAAISGKLVEAELAAVLALISRRVLGQYELVLPTGEDADTVTYVGPNILQLERTHQFRPEEFRFWVALHEMTHRAQFQGVPWLRGHFLGLVGELVEASRPEPGRLNRLFEEAWRRIDRGESLIDQRGLLGLFASDAQAEVIDRVQALMCLLEGHGHVVMDRLGGEHLRSQARMSRVLKSRRMDKRTAAFFRLTGLEMKLDQYRLGERFVLAVEAEAGWEAVGLAFGDPSSLPALAEVEDPPRWLRRVG